MHRWLPLSEALLRMVVRCVPNPIQAQRCRYSALLTRIDTHNAISHPFPLQQSSSSTDPHDILHCALAVENDIINCVVDAPAAVVVYISKMIPVWVEDLSFSHRCVSYATTSDGIWPRVFWCWRERLSYLFSVTDVIQFLPDSCWWQRRFIDKHAMQTMIVVQIRVKVMFASQPF